MKINFTKYHGAGNDFIMIDARKINRTIFSKEYVELLCERHFGIGADGLILLVKEESKALKMVYFNSDGREGTMCGNGGRCFAAFAREKGCSGGILEFEGIDGMHQAVFEKDDTVSLKMSDVNDIQQLEDGYLIETGSRHFVMQVPDPDVVDVFQKGREIRNQSRFLPSGTNVNFVGPLKNNELKIRTFERGVENETLACGTGAVAAAIYSYIIHPTVKTSYLVHALGGDLQVRFTPAGNLRFRDVWLRGGAEKVFEGEIDES